MLEQQLATMMRNPQQCMMMDPDNMAASIYIAVASRNLCYAYIRSSLSLSLLMLTFCMVHTTLAELMFLQDFCLF